MEVVGERVVRVQSLDAPVRIHCTGDWHVGEHGCAEARLRAAVQSAASERGSLAILLGDLASWIAPDDRRWEPAALADGISVADLGDLYSVMLARVADIARPLRGRVIGVISGNHEESFARRHHVDVGAHLAAEIGAPSLGYSALIRLVFKTTTEESDLLIYATHGAGAAATAGGKINRLLRTMAITDADLVLMGHVHQILDTTATRLVLRGGEIASRDQVGVVTGTYLRTYARGHSGYGERAGYAPVAIGHPCVSVVPRTRQISVERIGG